MKSWQRMWLICLRVRYSPCSYLLILEMCIWPAIFMSVFNISSSYYESERAYFLVKLF